MVYGYFKDLNTRTGADKILHDKVFNIVKNPKYDGYQHCLASMAYEFFDKKTSGGAATHARSENLDTQNKCTIKNEIISCKN